ncbi:MAG: hypothetical protein HYT12_03285 [Candidatus Liptonbacteria bacterium]|nr:hypothetical protein [Candidatus Liptonbacteria bacterium]
MGRKGVRLPLLRIKCSHKRAGPGWKKFLLDMAEKLKDPRAKGLTILKVCNRAGMLCVHFDVAGKMDDFQWVSGAIYDFEKMSLFICAKCGEWRPKADMLRVFSYAKTYKCRACGHRVAQLSLQRRAFTP